MESGNLPEVNCIYTEVNLASGKLDIHRCRRAMTTLSELHEDLVNYIFSKMDLTIKDVIQLSLVSKQFCSIIHKHPSLVFDARVSHSDMQLNHMISTLDRYHKHGIPLEKLTLKFRKSTWSSNHDQCIQLVTPQKGLKFLSLSMPKDYDVPRPDFVFEVDSLVELRLKKCYMDELPEIIAWRNLRQLRLVQVDFGMDEGVFVNIMRSCPLIEKLEVRRCYGDYRLEYLSASTKLGKPLYQNLKDLRIAVGSPKIKTTNDLILNFPRLEYLEIKNGYNKTMSISSPSLKRVTYVFQDRDVGLQQTHFNAPNMVAFDFIWWWTNGDTIFPDLSFTGNSSGWFSSILLIVVTELRSSWLMELKKILKNLLNALNSSEIASVTIDFNGRTVPKADEITVLHERLPWILDFVIQSDGMRFCSSSARAILDDIFLIFMPKKVIFWHTNGKQAAPIYEHNLVFPTSNHNELMEVLQDHEKEDRFYIVFNLKY